jgi:hypothetical protein
MAHFDFVKSCESEEGRTSIEDFMVDAIENRCEGLMVKVLFILLILVALVNTALSCSTRRQRTLTKNYQPRVD